MARQLRLSVFKTSKQVGRIPLILLRGHCVTTTRAFLNVLLSFKDFDDSAVVCKKYPNVAAPVHSRLVECQHLENSAQDGCLCCGMHGALGDVLRSLFFDALSRRSARLDRVLVESEAITSQQLAWMLKHTPFLGQRFDFQSTFNVVSIEQFLKGAKDLRSAFESVGHVSEQFFVVMLSEKGAPDLPHLKLPQWPSQQELSVLTSQWSNSQNVWFIQTGTQTFPDAIEDAVSFFRGVC